VKNITPEPATPETDSLRATELPGDSEVSLTLHGLLQKLDRIGVFGSFTFAVVISLAVQWDRPQINLDDLLK
jgi:hypothetical protein